jgi:hypothetical protein
MKIFNCYTIICALALTETTFAANVNSNVPRADQISQYLNVPGLRESDDLNWFNTRMSLKNDPYLMKTLIADVQHPTRFTDNRAALAKYCLKKKVSDKDYAGLVRVLIESKSYDALIELIIEDSGRFTTYVDISENACDEIFQKIVNLKNNDVRTEFYGVLQFAPQSNRLSIRTYANSILDPGIPERRYMEGILNTGEMLFEILFDVIKNAKTSGREQEVFARAINVLNNFGPDYYLDSSFSIKKDAARMALNMLTPGKVTMADLGISIRSLGDDFTYKFLISTAYALSNDTLIDEIISSLSESQMRVKFGSLLNGAQYYSGDQYVVFILRIFGRLCREAQANLLDVRSETPFFNFLLKNFKIYEVTKEQQNLKITFSTDNQYIVNNNLHYRFDYVIEIPGTVEQLKEWFSKARFASSTSFTHFVDGIDRSPAFTELRNGLSRRISINIDTFILIATNQILIKNLENYRLFVDIVENDLKNVHKLLENDSLLNVNIITHTDMVIKCIAPAVISDRMFENFKKLFHIEIIFSNLRVRSHNMKDEDYLGFRNVMLFAMKNSLYRNNLISNEISIPMIKEIIRKEFPELVIENKENLMSQSGQNTMIKTAV